MADFNQNTGLAELGIRVVAASVDTEEESSALVAELGITAIEMAYGLEGPAVAEVLGAYLDSGRTPPYLQPTAFILDPAGNVVQALYSSNVMGRLASSEVQTMVTMFTR